MARSKSEKTRLSTVQIAVSQIKAEIWLLAYLIGNKLKKKNIFLIKDTISNNLLLSLMMNTFLTHYSETQ